MAKVIASEHNTVAEPWWGKGKIVGLGLAAGISWWALTNILNKYVIEPFACRDLSLVDSCTGSLGTSGSIAAVLVAVLFAYVLVRALQPRPIIVTASALLLLWDLGLWTTGLGWLVTVLWAAGLYAVIYSLFSLVARMRVLWASALVALFIVVAIRLILTL